MEKLTKKERKLLKKQKKENSGTSPSKDSGGFSFLSVFLWVLGILVVGFIMISVRDKTRGPVIEPVHWHIPVEYELCGQDFFPQEKTPAKHGKVHGHNDRLAHVEGKIKDGKDISLGKYMDSIGLNFNENEIYTYKNGDTCPGSETSGTVKVLVDNKENIEFRDHVLKNKEKIKILFN